MNLQLHSYQRNVMTSHLTPGGCKMRFSRTSENSRKKTQSDMQENIMPKMVKKNITFWK